MRNDHHVVEIGRPTSHPAVSIKQQLRPNSSLPHRPIKIEMEEFGVTRMTSDRAWTVEQDIQGRSTDREDMPRHVMMAIYSDVTNLVMRGPKAANGLHRSYVTMRPDIDAPHTLFASLTKSWNMNSQKGSNP